MKKSLFVLALLSSTMFSCSPAMAMTDQEYVQAVSAGISPQWYSPSTLYGNVKVTVLIKDGEATLMQKSNNTQWNDTVLNAAKAALDGSIANGLYFDVEYKGKSLKNFPNGTLPVTY